MKRVLQVLAVLVVLVALGASWYVYSKQPTRQGTVTLANLQGSVTVRYDDRGVPHIRAENETDEHGQPGLFVRQPVSEFDIHRVLNHFRFPSLLKHSR